MIGLFRDRILSTEVVHVAGIKLNAGSGPATVITNFFTMDNLQISSTPIVVHRPTRIRYIAARITHNGTFAGTWSVTLGAEKNANCGLSPYTTLGDIVFSGQTATNEQAACVCSSEMPGIKQVPCEVWRPTGTFAGFSSFPTIFRIRLAFGFEILS